MCKQLPNGVKKLFEKILLIFNLNQWSTSVTIVT